jgi:hypothetical protein
MKKLAIISAIALSSFAYGQKCNCIQVLSTPNVHLLKPEEFTFTSDTALVEKVTIEGIEYHRVLFCYENFNKALYYFHQFTKTYKTAILIERKKEQVNHMDRLFSSL